MELRDESGFEFQVQDLRVKNQPRFQVAGSRVLDAPKPRTREVPSGYMTTRMEICFHGKLLKYHCSLCEFEAPRLHGR